MGGRHAIMLASALLVAQGHRAPFHPNDAPPPPPRVAFITEWIGPSASGRKPLDTLLPWVLATWASNAPFADFYVLTTEASWVQLASPHPNIVAMVRPRAAIVKGIAALLNLSSSSEVIVEDAHFWTNVRPMLASLLFEQLDVKSLAPREDHGENRGYSFWGYLENDVYLGNLTAFFPMHVLETHDVLTVQGPLPYESDFVTLSRRHFESVLDQVAYQHRGATPYGPTFFPNTRISQQRWRSAEAAARKYATFGSVGDQRVPGPEMWWAENVLPRNLAATAGVAVYRACCAVWGSENNRLGGDVRTDGCRKVWVDGEVLRYCPNRAWLDGSHGPVRRRVGACVNQLRPRKVPSDEATSRSQRGWCTNVTRVETKMYHGKTAWAPLHRHQQAQSTAVISVCHDDCIDFGFHTSSISPSALRLDSDHESSAALRYIPAHGVPFIVREPSAHKAALTARQLAPQQSGDSDASSWAAKVPEAFELNPAGHCPLSEPETRRLRSALRAAITSGRSVAVVPSPASGEPLFEANCVRHAMDGATSLGSLGDNAALTMQGAEPAFPGEKNTADGAWESMLQDMASLEVMVNEDEAAAPARSHSSPTAADDEQPFKTHSKQRQRWRPFGFVGRLVDGQVLGA